jgi:hypothetical protein
VESTHGYSSRALPLGSPAARLTRPGLYTSNTEEDQMATSRPDGSYTLGMWAAASVHLPKLFE